jgi:7,8-dihydropterin-6-yl-methyl-4-(beta-D-ribofuranosyl)aminobenzene 5'-phosphate synthase
MLGAG